MTAPVFTSKLEVMTRTTEGDRDYIILEIDGKRINVKPWVALQFALTILSSCGWFLGFKVNHKGP